MRPFAFAVLVLAGMVVSPAVAHAAVIEPDGNQVPLDPTDPNSPGYDARYTEIPLPRFFAMQGEGFDWLKDASTTPAVFSPLCGFTATFVLNQAGLKYGLAWYNAGPQIPANNDLHILIPANSLVGTVAKSADIKNDPNYKGGLIGFALVGGQTHYSEQQWNVSCVNCVKPGPWALALMYRSTKMPDSYYLAFEDGNVTASSFGNDGDFNDDVFLVTGVACQGAGQPCTTGKPGVCGDGLTECDGKGGISCRQQNAPGLETCDGLDEDCNGMVDDGAMCPNNQVCDRGRCVDPCGAAEFQCASDDTCDNGVCVEKGCVGLRCPSGQVCHQGQCRGACDGIACPHGPPELVCRVGRCVDPCDTVACPMNQVCNSGVCVPSCECFPCAKGLACAKSGLCVDPTCVNVQCGAGLYCKGGNCVDSCDGAVCPANQACEMGICKDLPPADMAMSESPDLSAPFTLDGGPGSGGGDAGTGKTLRAGCNCRVGNDGAIDPAGPAIVLIALLSGMRRRNRERRI